jgi:diphthamide synthase (EF-2-diphthine--ammonia ligase)
MIAGGVRAFVTCLDPRKIGRELAGRSFDLEFLGLLPASADPCGENGEFHTFAWDGPGFAHPIGVRVGETVEREGFVFTDVLAA